MGLFEAKWLRPLAQFQKSRDYPLFDGMFTRQEESSQRIASGRLYATGGQVTNAGETPSSGKIQDRRPLLERALFQGIVVS
jgi:hypothetical protein